MNIFNRFPNTEFNDLNLDWIIKTVGKLSKTFDEVLAAVIAYVEEHLGDIALSKFYRADDETVILAEEYKNTGTPAGDVRNIQIDDNMYSIPINPLKAFYRPLYNRLILNDHVTTGTLTNQKLDHIQIGDDIYTIPTASPGQFKAALQNSKCLLMGNSWARGTGGDPPKGWCYYFQEITGCQATIIKQSGGDFCGPGNNNADYPGETYVTIMQNIIPSTILPDADERAEYNYIIVGGCLNDQAYSNSQVRNAIRDFVIAAKTYFPNAEIWIVPLVPSLEADIALMNTIDAWNTGAELTGAATCSHTYGWFYGKPEYLRNNSLAATHLNDDGYKRCGELMAALVTGWDGCVNVRNHIGWSGNNKCTYSRVNYTRQDMFTYLNLQFTISGADLTSGIQIGQIDIQYAPKQPIMIPAARWTSNAATRALDGCIVDTEGKIIYRTLGTTVNSDLTYTMYINSTFRIG